MNKLQITNYKFFILFVIWCLGFSASAYAQSVDILWQGDTYTPPFYLGRSLWSTQSKITFVAIPSNLGSPVNLYYKWTRNGTVLGDNNGVGKNTLIFIDDILSRTQDIKIDIISANNEVLASASTEITPITPMATIYENSPLYGFLFHKAVGQEYALKEGEVTFTAFPLFFKANSRTASNLTYEWRTDNGGLETRSSVIYRAPDNASGASQVSLRASNKNEITQDARKGFLVKFGQ